MLCHVFVAKIGNHVPVLQACSLTTNFRSLHKDTIDDIFWGLKMLEAKYFNINNLWL